MATSDHIANALLTEHFRYTPLTLLDDIINTVNELVFQAINAIEEGLSSTSAKTLGFKPTPAQQKQLHPTEQDNALQETKQTEIENGIVQLESLLNATVDRDFDKFEIYTLRNILSVGHEGEELARWVQLNHYKGLELDGAEGNGGEKVSAEEVQMLRRKVQESGKLNVMLKAEEARNARVLAQLRELTDGTNETSPFGFLADGAAGEMRPEELLERVRGSMLKVPEITESLENLKTSLQTLPGVGAEAGSSVEETARRQYLADQSRRILQRRGMEAGVTGEGSGGATGRRIGREEVEGLETVVQALAGAGDENK